MKQKVPLRYVIGTIGVLILLVVLFLYNAYKYNAYKSPASPGKLVSGNIVTTKEGVTDSHQSKPLSEMDDAELGMTNGTAGTADSHTQPSQSEPRIDPNRPVSEQDDAEIGLVKPAGSQPGTSQSAPIK